MGYGDVVCWIHGSVKGYGHDVLDEIPPGLFLEGSGPDLIGEVLHTDEIDMLAGHALSDTPDLRSRYCPSTTFPKRYWPGSLGRSRNHRGEVV